MFRILILIMFSGFSPVFAEDEPAEEKPQEEETKYDNGDGISSPKTMSGMSILAQSRLR